MGVFSWITQDTERSIPSINNIPGRGVFTVYMKDNKGNVWKEDRYEGYGEFGGKDFYELVAEMNGGPSDRDHGINIYFDDDNMKAIYPSLTEDEDWEWDGSRPDDCPYQGYFYEFYEEEKDNYSNPW